MHNCNYSQDTSWTHFIEGSRTPTWRGSEVTELLSGNATMSACVCPFPGQSSSRCLVVLNWGASKREQEISKGPNPRGVVPAYIWGREPLKGLMSLQRQVWLSILCAKVKSLYSVHLEMGSQWSFFSEVFSKQYFRKINLGVMNRMGWRAKKSVAETDWQEDYSKPQSLF